MKKWFEFQPPDRHKNQISRQDRGVTTTAANHNHHDPRSPGHSPREHPLHYLSDREFLPHVDADTPRRAIVVADGSAEQAEKFLRLNVGGSSFCIRRETLMYRGEGSVV